MRRMSFPVELLRERQEPLVRLDDPGSVLSSGASDA
jgi:hypothetical protein